MASGPSIRTGVVCEELSLLDLAPLLLYSLEIPIPNDISGRLPAQVLTEQALNELPVRYVEASRNIQNVAEIDAGIDEEAEATILKRLRALGYVE
jgi:hypothetical protein